MLEDVFDLFLLESAFNDESLIGVCGASGAQLGKEILDHMLHRAIHTT